MSPRIFHSSLPPIEPIKADLLTHLFSNPRNTPDDKPIYIDAVTGAVRTYGAIIQRTRSLAHGLRSLGVKPRDVVAVFSPNSIDYAITCYAILGCGATVSPVSAAYTAQELSSQLKTCGAKHLIAHSSLLETAKSATTPLDPSIIIIQADGQQRDDATGPPTAETLATTCPPSALVSISPSEASERLSFMCFSSGTTGAAKGVMTTHLNIVANTQQWVLHIPEDVTGNITTVAFLPLSHIYGFVSILIMNMLVGNTTVLLPRFEPELFLSSLAKYQPETIQVVPPIMLLLAKYPNLDRYDLSSLKRITSAAAPLSVELREAVERRFKTLYGATVVCRQGWGMTETSPLGAMMPIDRLDKQHTVGNITSSMEFRVVDPETMRDVDIRAADGSTEPGELWCRGPNVTKGYYRNEEATRNGFFQDPPGPGPNGDGKLWFRTGDVGFLDKDGFITIVDRIKEMIKYKGLQVIPSELEGKLLEHPAVEDACVIGLWIDEDATELPVGFVVVNAQTRKAKGDKSVIDDVNAWLNVRVANHKKLRGGLFIVDAIPKSPSGKILRRQLKDTLLKKVKGVSKL
ncbi:hypothetical protein RBB50_006132 [Rhinocladiella similis]|jgi:acyl-CoA synthetase (AMP-forming)/AMP-acid ligase II